MSDSMARSMALLARLGARQLSDPELLAQYTSTKDPAAFAECVRRHGPMVLGVCRRMLGQVHDTEDAFQATFLVFAQRAKHIRNPGALPAWLYGTAVRVCRKIRVRRKAPQPLSLVAKSAEDPFADVAWKELRGLLDEEVGCLPTPLRDPLLLCFFSGLTRDEAAKRLGCSRRTLMRRLEQARERLRRRLERRGVGNMMLGIAVLPPDSLLATVPYQLQKAAVAVGTGGPIPAAVGAMAAGTTIKLFQIITGVMLILAGGSLSWATFAVSSTDPPAAQLAEPAPPPALGTARLLDSDGLPLPAGAVHRLGSRRFRVEGRNDLVLPTPDGRYVLLHPQPALSAYSARGLVLYDPDSGIQVRTFEQSRRVAKTGTQEAIRPATFSPDGAKLYALGYHKSLEPEGNRNPGRSELVTAWATFHNAVKRVLLVWDVATGQLTAEWELPDTNLFNPHGSSLIGVNVSPDGKRLYVYGAVRMHVAPDRTICGDPGVHVIDTATGRVLHTWDGAGHIAGTVAGGKELIAFRRESDVVALDAETGKPVRRFPLPGFIPSVALSPDGKTVAAVGTAGTGGQRTSTVKLWDAATGRVLRQFTPDTKEIGYSGVRLVFAADGKTLYLGAGSGRILRWELSQGTELEPWSAHRGKFADLCVRPGRDELVSTGYTDGAIRCWNATTGKPAATGAAYLGHIAIARAPDGKTIAMGDIAGRLDVWDLRTGRIMRTVQLPASNDREIAFSPDGRSLIDAMDGGKLVVRDPMTGTTIRDLPSLPRLKQNGGGWSTLTFSADGRHLLASAYDFGTQLLRWPEGSVVWRLGESYHAVCSPDGTGIVAGNWNGKTLLLDAKTGGVVTEWPGDSMATGAFSPDGRRLATAHLYGLWRIRDAKTGAVLKEMPGIRFVWDVAFSRSGWLLAVAGDTTVRVFDTATWQEVARCDGHEGTLRSVFFGPDESTLVSVSSEDGTALVWSLKPPASRESLDPTRLWAELAGDGPIAFRAVWSAAQDPEAAIRLFRKQWPVTQKPPDPALVRKLVEALDANTFAAREAAEAELAKLGRSMEPALRKAVAETDSAEVKRRVQRLLGRWTPPTTTDHGTHEARELRAVWSLELAGTEGARELLRSWASAKIGIRLGDEAEAALRRWGR